jgi:hypothetical protein
MKGLTTISFDDAIPPYAILSHTWGADTEEVIFADLKQAMARTNLVTGRYASVANKHSKMVCGTSGLTHAALTSRTRLSSLRLSSLCLDGTKTRLDAMYTYLTYR